MTSYKSEIPKRKVTVSTPLKYAISEMEDELTGVSSCQDKQVTQEESVDVLFGALNDEIVRREIISYAEERYQPGNVEEIKAYIWGGQWIR